MIIDLLKDYKTERVSFTSFSVGSFVFDCTVEEAHESFLTVTENAMESGALMSDHSYLEPKSYAVRGIMVSYTPFNLFSQKLTDDLNFIKTLPALTGIVSQTQQAMAAVNRYAGKAANAVNSARAGAKRLAPWLPNSLSSLGDQTTDTLSRIAQAYDDLLTIQANGELLDVTTGLRTYNSMQLTGVVCNHASQDSAEFALQFKEIFVVETQTVQGLVVNVPTASTSTTTSKVDGAKKTGRSEAQAAKPKAKGKTQPTKQSATKKSVARSIGDIIRGSA